LENVRSILQGCHHLISGSQITFANERQTTQISSFLLKANASLAQVFHASGVSEAIDTILAEWIRYEVLAEDGSDADLMASSTPLIRLNRRSQQSDGKVKSFVADPRRHPIAYKLRTVDTPIVIDLPQI
jgi:hypothetical protein